MDNLEIYNKLREVPESAKKPIIAGRLKGFTDINPMWRIKKLTETFGPCGIGWYIKVVNFWTEEGDNGTKAVFCHLELYTKVEDGGWSAPIVGIGGSMLVAKERNGMYTSDEAYKMAYTDAISIACKALGMGADVYFAKDISTKYQSYGQGGNTAPQITKVAFPSGNKATWNSAVSFLKKGGDIAKIKHKYAIPEDIEEKLLKEAKNG